MEAIDVFYPERMAERIRMGDVVSLVERAQESSLMKKKREKFKKKIAKNEFGFDFLSQIQQVKRWVI
jgi:signal recognition particle subunit SRP54